MSSLAAVRTARLPPLRAALTAALLTSCDDGGRRLRTIDQVYADTLAQFDRDGDGKLQQVELLQVDPTQSARGMDADADGEVTVPELRQWIELTHPRPPMLKPNPAGDGQLPVPPGGALPPNGAPGLPPPGGGPVGPPYGPGPQGGAVPQGWQAQGQPLPAGGPMPPPAGGTQPPPPAGPVPPPAGGSTPPPPGAVPPRQAPAAPAGGGR